MRTHLTILAILILTACTGSTGDTDGSIGAPDTDADALVVDVVSVDADVAVADTAGPVDTDVALLDMDVALVDADVALLDIDVALVDVDIAMVDADVAAVDADIATVDADVSLGDAAGPLCGQEPCPPLAGYSVACNGQAHCEYTNEDPTGWKKWDVWIWIPPGEFQMGSEGEGGLAEEQPVHAVTFTTGFYIGKYEIVVEQYEACVIAGGCWPADTSTWDAFGWGTNTSAKGRGQHPQNGLTPERAQFFCGWVIPGGRLPTEAEHEYARTGPVHRLYPWGDSPAPTCGNDVAVFNEVGGPAGFGCGQGGTWPVGSKPAGAAWSGGLDMSGNLWEWCEDYYHDSYIGAPSDGSAWMDPATDARVIRGGSFDYVAVHLRSAARHGTWPGSNHAAFGGRCARPAD